MAFDAQGYKRAAQQAGIPQDVIDQTIASRSGVRGWLTQGNQGLGGVATAAGNLLNVPSYAIGGALKQISNNGQSPIRPMDVMNPVGGFARSVRNQGLGNTVKTLAQVPGKIVRGNIQGLMNKEAVFENLPKSIGVDPNSTAGMAIGLGGELLAPEVPVSKLAKLGKLKNVFKGASKAENVFSKVGGVVPDAGRALLQKSYKLSASDIDKIAEALNVTDEAEKAPAVFKYLEDLGLSGATNSSLKKLNSLVDPLQESYNTSVRSGKVIDRAIYANQLMSKADELEMFANDTNTRSVVEKLRREAKTQSALASQGIPMTDEILTNTKSSYYKAGKNAIGNPFEASFNKAAGDAGASTLEVIAPGSSKTGQELRKLREVQNVLGKKSRTGLGTQLINTFKPSAAGFGVGATLGYSNDQNPLASGIAGGAALSLASTPQALNLAGKVLTSPSKIAGTSKVLPKVAPLVGPAIQKGFRLSQAETARSQKQPIRLQQEDRPNKGLISPVAKIGPTQGSSKSSYTPSKKNVFQEAVSRRLGL